MGKPLSWKWKIGIGIVCFLLFSTAFLMSPPGQKWAKATIDTKFQEMPENERAESSYATHYRWLAYFKGYFVGDEKEAVKMYQEWLGILPDKDGNAWYLGRPFEGKVSKDGKVGWGPLHPDAPDCFEEYIDLLNKVSTDQRVAVEARAYYRLFYDFPQSIGKPPHPKFRKHWERITLYILKRGGGFEADMDKNATNAPPWPPPETTAPAEK